MAEEVLFNIAEKIIEKISSRILEEFGIWWGINDELQKLKDTVSMIQAVLLDAEEQYPRSNQVKVWLGMLKEAVYEADDLLDLFSTRALKKQTMTGSKLGKEVRIFFSSSNQFVYGLKMAHRIKSIRERLDEIAESRKFHLEERLVENFDRITREREQTHSSLPRLVVGRENDKKEIMKFLLSHGSQNNVSIISIVGIGGLGKTTLAQLLLDDEVIKTHFELKLWVCVAENFDIKSIVEKILESIQSKKPRNLEMNTLKNQLRTSINGKKYILVLDDVWNENPQRWFDLVDLLDGGAEGSKIIITTRVMNVARIARSDLDYKLKGLSDNESWDLFQKVAFVGGKVPSASLEEIGKEIVEKCKGVPLAIKAIGGLLYSKESEVQWRSFRDRELSTVNQLGDNDILGTLRLSYTHLPSHLKHCFAYCRLFPKDYKIDVHTLIDLWIAQGFVRSSNATQSLQDIGLQYFEELHWRSFFQEVEYDDFGCIDTCKMHDLMHELAISVAGGEVTSSNSNGLNVDRKTRHISIDCGLYPPWQHLPSLHEASKVRTVLLVNKSIFEEDRIAKQEQHLIFSKLKCLRALDLHALRIERVPHSINKLELLTYLDLSRNGAMKKLPNSICRLQNLQVLKVDSCWSLEELPKDIRRLVKLRCLSMFGCYKLTHMPRGIGQLTGLETLNVFVVDKKGRGAELSELKNLKKLRGTLSIRNLRYVKNPKFDFQALNLKERKHILGLFLDWDSSTSSEDDNEDFSAKDIENDEMAIDMLQPHHNLKNLGVFSYKGVKYPCWLPTLTTLVGLCLEMCKNIQCLPQFDQFPSLKSLRLVELPNLQYIENGMNFFPSLAELNILDCPNLKGWVRVKNDSSRTESSPQMTTTTELPHFQCLSELVIYRCPNLNSVPPSPSVESLHFEGKSLKPLEQLLESNISAAEHNSSSPLSQLKEMTIAGIEEEASLPGELQQKLTSLTNLYVSSCPGIVKMETPPFGLRGLRTLGLWNMHEMESLPNWLQHLSTLKFLMLDSCDNLASLPEWMSDLTSLKHFSFRRCPKLSKRCKNNKGEDWPKIAHIPEIEIDNSMVQWNGQYINE